MVITTPRPLYPRERTGTYCTGGWAGPRAGLDGCGKSRPIRIRSPDRPDRSESLYRLSYPPPAPRRDEDKENKSDVNCGVSFFRYSGILFYPQCPVGRYSLKLFSNLRYARGDAGIQFCRAHSEMFLCLSLYNISLEYLPCRLLIYKHINLRVALI